jgi:putative transposase
MRRLDESYLEHSFAGARMVVRMLRCEGYVIGRKHVGTLMKRMVVEALHRASNMSRQHAGEQDLHRLLSVPGKTI